MKKILAILLSLLSCGFLSACSAEKTQPDTPQCHLDKDYTKNSVYRNMYPVLFL